MHILYAGGDYANMKAIVDNFGKSNNLLLSEFLNLVKRNLKYFYKN